MGAWLIEHFGWRTAVLPVFASCAIVAVLAFLCMRNRPQDVALRPYGADPATPLAPPPAAKMTFATPFVILRSVAAHRTFWILFGTFFICGLSTNGLIQTHFISLCGDSGLSAVPAASVLAMMGAFDLFGTILSGWLSDRYDNRKLLFWYYGLRGCPCSGCRIRNSPCTACRCSPCSTAWTGSPLPPTVKLGGGHVWPGAGGHGVWLDLRRPPAMPPWPRMVPAASVP